MAGIMITLMDATTRRPRDARAAEPTRIASSPRPLRSGRPPRRHRAHVDQPAVGPADTHAEPDRTPPAC